MGKIYCFTPLDFGAAIYSGQTHFEPTLDGEFIELRCTVDHRKNWDAATLAAGFISVLEPQEQGWIKSCD